jgi:hypothetical protein
MLPDLGRAERIGEFWGYPESRAFAELLIDCEEGRRRVLLTLPSEQPRPVEATDNQKGIKHPYGGYPAEGSEIEHRSRRA